MEKRFLTINEVCKYTGFGKTKTREMIKKNNLYIMCGNKYFIDKNMLDKYLDRCIRIHKGI